jgi:hypothetical protein
MFLDMLQDIHASHTRHFDIEQDNIIQAGLDKINRFRTIRRSVDFKLFQFFEFGFEEVGYRLFIVDNQNVEPFGHPALPAKS